VKPRSDGGVTGRGSELPRVPDDSIWIDCELLAPGQVPADEECIVEAEGEMYWSSGRIIEDRYTIEVEVGVPFRVALARGTREARIRLNARYHYLKAPIEIDLSAVRASTVVIEPELGGVIRGRVLLPGSANPVDAGRVGATSLPPPGHPVRDFDLDFHAPADMEAEGSFELRGRVHTGGEPHAGWLVGCENDNGERAAAHCDDAGGFVMNLGSPGPFLFSFFPSGQALGSLQTLRVGRDIPDRDVVELDFDLPAGCLAGRVRLPGGAPAPGC